jgi:hypothetical protein
LNTSRLFLNRMFVASIMFAAPCLSATIRVPQDITTIQAAIDAAAVGDVISVAPGTYAGPIDMKGKSISIRGSGLSSQVVLQGGQSVVRCNSGEASACTIENVTITGGSAIDGGGVRVINASPTFKNCRIILNTSAGATDCRGGGVFVSGGAPTFDGCSISANSCTPFGYGGACGGHQDKRCVGKGGGIYIEESSATLLNCTISGNEVAANSIVGGNPLVDVQAGGIWRSGSGSVTINNCRITGNSVSGSASGSNQSCCTGSGGAAVISGMTYIAGSRISDNTKSGCGDSVGGVKVYGVGVFLVNTQICGNAGVNIPGSYVDEGGNVVRPDCPTTCPTDLDGNGTVDTGDVALILLDFGPCQ